MTITVVSNLLDARIRARSLLCETTWGAYLSLTTVAYGQRGNIEGQREALRTTTALRIRERMSKDLQAGAILPPLVLGLLVTEAEVEKETWSTDELVSLLQRLDPDSLSIIDGMQRTTVLREVVRGDARCTTRLLRVEVCMVAETSSLTYRMLVLNTGQAPWNLRRQIEVVNASLLREIRATLGRLGSRAEIFGVDDRKRRTAPAEYQANEVIEMYLAFGLRKTTIEAEAVLADQFSRLDMVEAVSERTFLSKFSQVLNCLVQLDTAFGRLTAIPGVETAAPGEAIERRRFENGRSLFDSQPACAGFMVACAQAIFGRPGGPRDPASQTASLNRIVSRCNEVAARTDTMTVEELADFIDLNTLNDVLMRRVSSRIGEFERNLFLEAFRALLAEDQLSSMTVCWRAF